MKYFVFLIAGIPIFSGCKSNKNVIISQPIEKEYIFENGSRIGPLKYYSEVFLEDSTLYNKVADHLDSFRFDIKEPKLLRDSIKVITPNVSNNFPIAESLYKIIEIYMVYRKNGMAEDLKVDLNQFFSDYSLLKNIRFTTKCPKDESELVEISLTNLSNPLQIEDWEVVYNSDHNPVREFFVTTDSDTISFRFLDSKPEIYEILASRIPRSLIDYDMK